LVSLHRWLDGNRKRPHAQPTHAEAMGGSVRTGMREFPRPSRTLHAGAMRARTAREVNDGKGGLVELLTWGERFTVNARCRFRAYVGSLSRSGNSGSLAQRRPGLKVQYYLERAEHCERMAALISNREVRANFAELAQQRRDLARQHQNLGNPAPQSN